jgi:hypothetical protein
MKAPRSPHADDPICLVLLCLYCCCHGDSGQRSNTASGQVRTLERPYAPLLATHAADPVGDWGVGEGPDSAIAVIAGWGFSWRTE